MRKFLLATLSLAVMLFSLTACGDLSDNSRLIDDFESQSDMSEFIAENTNPDDATDTQYESMPDEYLNSQNIDTTEASIPDGMPAQTTKPNSTATKPPVTTKQPSTTKPSGGTSSEFVSEVVRLVNEERAKAGISPVSMSTDLNSAAAIRADEIITRFDHTRPDGSSCFTVLKELNISYKTAGENIAVGQTSPQQVMQGWMNSEGHRKNILNPSFGRIGVGYVKGGSYGHNWAQLFTD